MRLTIGAAIGVAALCAAAPAVAQTGRFTLTRTLPDGRVETRTVTAAELAALSRPAPASAPAAEKVPAAADPLAAFKAAQAVVAKGPVKAAPKVPTTAAPAEPAASAKLAASTPLSAPAARTVVSATAVRIASEPVETDPRFAVRRLALVDGWTLAGDADDDDALSPVVVEHRKGGGGDRKSKLGQTRLGVRDGRAFGERGRFYLYAGGKGGGVGLNLTDHNGADAGGWASDGMSYDRGGFSGQRSAGLGWRKGDVSTSLGWVHEKNRVNGVWAAPTEKDDRVALSFSWRPSPH